MSHRDARYRFQVISPRGFEMKMTNLIKRSFSTSKIRNRKEKQMVDGEDYDHFVSLGLSF